MEYEKLILGDVIVVTVAAIVQKQTCDVCFDWSIN